ncbi:putative serine/threonine-protein kinase wnk5 [Dinochytrium kinnereticum]|nr:putative serine/threonine-protein kinase wnk5 [Dinochytrium kinnereticum]
MEPISGFSPMNPISGKQDSMTVQRQNLNVSGVAPSKDSDDDEDEENRVVETDPTGRFQRFNKSLGKGAYKEVFKAFDDEEGVEVAWNRLRLDHLRKQDAVRILSEIKILQSLRNDNIINLFAAWSSPSGVDGRERVIFITELMTSGTLKQYLRRTKGPLKPKVLKSLCRQVLSGLNYLHTRSPPIIHRDLKCENIFINGNNAQAKIGDLGLAVVKSKDHVSSVLGTPEFMAPELYDEKYDEKVDIYAFGMVVIEIVTKEYPYSECSNQAQIYKKVTTGIKPQALHRIQEEDTRKFVDSLITFDPRERPSAAELLQHPFLQIPPTSINPSSSAMSANAGIGSSTHSLDTVSSDNSAQMSLRNADQSPLESQFSLSDSVSGSLPRMSNASNAPAYNTAEAEGASVAGRRSASQTFSEGRADFGSMDRYRRASETIGNHHYVGSNGTGSDNGLEMPHQERLVRKSSTAFSNPPSPRLSLSRNVPMDMRCRVTIELVGKTSDAIFTLKMLYTASLDDKNSTRMPSQREMKFPFNIVEDTATDVVSEMVRESLVKEEDEPVVRKRLEEAIKEYFFFSGSRSGAPSNKSSPQIPRSHSASDFQNMSQSSAPAGVLTPSTSMSSIPSVTAAADSLGDNMSPRIPLEYDYQYEDSTSVASRSLDRYARQLSGTLDLPQGSSILAHPGANSIFPSAYDQFSHSMAAPTYTPSFESSMRVQTEPGITSGIRPVAISGTIHGSLPRTHTPPQFSLSPPSLIAKLPSASRLLENEATVVVPDFGDVPVRSLSVWDSENPKTSNSEGAYRRGVSGSSAASERSTSGYSDAMSATSSIATSLTNHSSTGAPFAFTPPLHGTSLALPTSNAGGWVTGGGVSPTPHWSAQYDSKGPRTAGPAQLPQAMGGDHSGSLSRPAGPVAPSHLSSLPQLNLPKAWSPPLDRQKGQQPTSMSPPSSSTLGLGVNVLHGTAPVQRPQNPLHSQGLATAPLISRPGTPNLASGGGGQETVGQKLLEMQVKNINLLSSGGKSTESLAPQPVSLLQQQQQQLQQQQQVAAKEVPAPAAAKLGAYTQGSLPPPMVPTKSNVSNWGGAQGHARSRSLSGPAVENCGPASTSQPVAGWTSGSTLQKAPARMSTSKLDYLAKYRSPAPNSGILPDVEKKLKKKKKRSTKTVTVSHSTMIIDEGEDWVGNKDDEDEELRPVMVDMVPMEERFKADSWAVIKEGEVGAEPARSDLAISGKRRRTPSPSPPPGEQRRRRRTPSPSPTPEDHEGQDTTKRRRRDDIETDGEGKRSRKGKMSDGTGAGLQTAEEVRRDLEKRRKEEMDALTSMDPTRSGRDAETVYRDKSGRRINLEEQRARDEAIAAEKRAEEEERLKFREGLTQQRMIEERLRRLEEEKTSSFAVYADDKDRNNEMMERDRWGDPLARLGGTDKKKKGAKKRYQGPTPAPNRYGIEPGYRWDGVDRGNSFEMKLIQARYARQSNAEEAYKWSTETAGVV